MQQILGKKIIERDRSWLEKQIAGRQVCLDIGCGDGKWTYRFAEENSEMMVIGIDADAASLEKISHKASRKPSKGGLDNVLFVKSFAENLPAEITNLASYIYINFPWGSLLSGVINGQPAFLRNISSAAQAGCHLKVCTTYHYKYEPKVIDELQLPKLNSDLKEDLQANWQEFGWQLASWQKISSVDSEKLDLDDKQENLASTVVKEIKIENPQPQFPQTSWWKEISENRTREVWVGAFVKNS